MAFGESAWLYHLGRRQYPQSVIEYILTKLPRNAFVIDVGCGTGLASRQLSPAVRYVIGVDVDLDMLKIANRCRSNNELYLCGQSTALPINDYSIDAVSAFAALQHFSDKETFAEITRVLKPKGVACIVNTYDISNLRVVMSEVFKSVTGRSYQSPREGYCPKTLLLNNSFRNVKERKWSTTEEYSRRQLVNYIRSTRMWTQIPKKDRLRVVEKILFRLNCQFPESIYTREIVVVSVIGVRPNTIEY